jgi:hypothetical protein
MDNKEFILSAFSKKQQKKLSIPRNILEQEDLRQKRIITWIDIGKNLGIIILNAPDLFKGMVLGRGKMNPGKVVMCSFCLGVYPASQMAFFTYETTENGKMHSVGHYACAGLDCEKRLLDPNTNNVHSMRETLTKDEKVERYYANVEKFFRDMHR